MSVSKEVAQIRPVEATFRTEAVAVDTRTGALLERGASHDSTKSTLASFISIFQALASKQSLVPTSAYVIEGTIHGCVFLSPKGSCSKRPKQNMLIRFMEQ